MGIRCYCPNGHKLNLKAYLAGKKGICPECGAKFRIPLSDSDEPTMALADRPAPLITPSGQIAGTGLPDFDFSFPDPSAGPRSASPSAASQPVMETPRSSFQPATIPTRSIPDPIDEQPNAMWYVRTPAGEQFGPARGPAMRTWIVEGRVTSESYVWREGWSDWRLAADVLVKSTPGTRPVTRAIPTAAPVMTAVSPIVPVQLAPPAATGRTSSPRNYSVRNSTLTFVILLTCACILLLAVLVWVLLQRSQ